MAVKKINNNMEEKQKETKTKEKEVELNIQNPEDAYNPEEFCPTCGAHVSEGCVHMQKAEEEVQEAVNKEVGEDADPVLQAFKNIKNKPSDEQINELKEKFNKIYVTVLDDNQAYIYRALKRSEWIALQAQDLKPHMLDEQIFRRCVIWPKDMTLNIYDAGVVPTVVAMIMRVSKFISEEEAVYYTREL